MGVININNPINHSENLPIINSPEIFNDFEEVKEDIFIGIGIKRMRAYKCDLKIDELYKKREIFWKIKTNRNENNWITWKIIHRAVSYDEMRANLLLEEYKIKTVNGCINHLIDENGNHYKIPNYCINEPYFEKELENENIKEEKITIHIYGNQSNFMIEVNNNLNGKELKNKIIKYLNLNENKILRLFVGGIEIKDSNFLYQYKINKERPVFLLIK